MIQQLLAKMSLREKIYQTMIMRSENYIYDDETAANTLSSKPFGGFFVGEEIIGSETMKDDEIMRAVRRAQANATIPPIICADTEFGCGYMFTDNRYPTLPWQMSLGATADTALAYEYGKYTAIPAREIGINLSLGPVADINLNFLNPVVNTRAIGDDPALVRDMLVAQVKGMQTYGMGATAKHFPGDGVDYRDQHYVLTANTLSVEDWKASFGAVYQALIDAGLLCVMLGHISFPAYQKERIEGIAPPATLSKELVCDLLKGELGFPYAVMSDALCMNAFRTTYCNQVKSELACFKAGVDLMLWPTEAFADALEEAIVAGEIPMSRLDDAVTRILRLKQALGLFGGKTFATDDVQKGFDITARVAESAITLVRDTHHLLPQTAPQKIAVIALTDHEDEWQSLKSFRSELEDSGADVCAFRNVCTEDSDRFDLIIYVTFCHQHKPHGMLQITPDWSTGALSREKSMVVCFGSPYLINWNFPTLRTAVAAYSDDAETQRATAKAILGKIPFSGKLPVRLQEI